MPKKDPWYSSWRNSINRCRYGKHKSYIGITNNLTESDVKKLWIRDGADFMKRPSIDRINNDKNYSYENCRFIELSENIRRANHSNGGRATVMPKEHYDYISWMLFEGFGVESISRVVGYCDGTILKIKQGEHRYQRELSNETQTK